MNIFTNTMNQSIKHFLAFLKRPIDLKQEKVPFTQKFGNLLALMVVDLPLAGVFIGIMYVLEYFELINQEDHKLAGMMDQVGIIGMMVLGVLIMPLIEEFLFRTYLRYKYNIWFRFRELLVKMDTTNEEERTVSIDKIKQRYQKVYPYIFYFSAIIFGLVHLFNFKLNLSYLLLAPILVGPQIIAGLIAGYLRVQFNIWMGYLYHALHNAIFLALPILYFTFFVETHTYETDAQTLVIKEAFMEGNTNFSSTDSVNLGNMRLQAALAYLTDKDEESFEFTDSKVANKKVHLKVWKKNANKTLDFNFTYEKVLEHFHLKEEKKHKTRTVYMLMVADTELFYANKHGEGDPISESKTFNNTLSCSNVSMYEFCRKLNEFSGIIVKDETNNGDTYNIQLHSKNLDEMKLELLEEYGLVLSAQKDELEYVVLTEQIDGKQ